MIIPIKPIYLGHNSNKSNSESQVKKVKKSQDNINFKEILLEEQRKKLYSV